MDRARGLIAYITISQLLRNLEANHRSGREKFHIRVRKLLGAKRLLRAYGNIIKYQGPTIEKREQRRIHSCLTLVPLVLKMSHSDHGAKHLMATFLEIANRKY